MTDYDIIIVGAGPAGSTVARSAAENGLNVLLLEKRQEIGVPVCCAEGVGKEKFNEIFKDIDKKWISAEVDGAKVYSPDKKTEIVLSGDKAGNEAGYVLNRKIFDKDLVKLATLAGSDLMVKTTATGLKKNKDQGTIELTMQNSDEIFTAETKILIGADGIESKIGNWAGMNTTLNLNELESCVQYQMTNIDFDERFCHFYLSYETIPGGYLWIFPKGKNVANIGLGVLSSLSKKSPKEYLDNFVNNNFPDGKIIEINAGGVPVGYPLKSAVNDNVMLVGDAARHVDPITGGGILNAMIGGLFATNIAIKSINKKDYSVKTLKKYDELWKNDFGKTLHRNKKVQEKLLTTDDKTLNSIFHSMENYNITEANTKKLLYEIIKRNPKLLWDLKDLFI